MNTRQGLWQLALAAPLLVPNARADTATSRPATSQVAVRGQLPGFMTSRHFGEQVREYRVEPGVKIHINAPAAAAFDPRRPTAVIIYALPNGNTTAQTIGRQMAPGLDWHFDIQHIGAQVRRLREVASDENIVVAYVEADGRSWPAWRAKHADYGKLIGGVVDSIRGHFEGPRVAVDLACHSGGGAFVLGFVDGVDRIPDHVGRIAFLDANYGYSDEQRHGDKLIEWLKRGPEHFLNVIAYDDRYVQFNGKLIVGPDGGTYRKTLRMIARLRRDLPLSVTLDGGYTRYCGLGGRVDIILHDNPKNVILHTALVGEMSGFIHAMTSGTKYEDKAGRFKGPVGYRRWIQPD
jgi:hypothetical protein